MQDRRIIREQAVRLAIRTGWTPDLEFIWSWQESEGADPCFGSYTDRCLSKCRWVAACKTFASEIIDRPAREPDSPPPLRAQCTHRA